MGKLIQEEHAYSSTPLMDRCCAMCGKMLASSTPFKNAKNWNGKRGPACQVRGSKVSWDSMPPFLLLWSKRKLGVYLRAVCNYNNERSTLTCKKIMNGRKVGYEEAPWLVFRPYAEKYVSPASIYRNDGTEVLWEETPWWYCNSCYSYYFMLKATDPRRVPMRNKLEGLYTRWHWDLSFVHLRPKLVELYPDLRTLPTTDEVLEWRQLRNKYVEFQKDKSLASPMEIELLRQKLKDKELEWSPPPHLTSWKTPIPQRYFDQAKGSRKNWKLKECALNDLVPCEQCDLIQDVKELPEMEELKSSESRSCISLCRPYGRFVDKRKEKGRGPVMSTQTHQTGELCMRPLTPQEDTACGMLTGVVADEETLKEKF